MREVGERSETDGSSPGNSTRVGFTGHQQDNDLGFTDMGGRVYDPLAGRFTTADPVIQAPFWSQGQNRYAYVFNDPINATDPSGFMADSEIAGGVAPGIVGGSITGGTMLAGIHGAAGSVGGTFGTMGGSMLHTMLLTPGGPPANTSFQVAAPSAAPTSSLNKANGMGSAPGAAQPPGPVPDRWRDKLWYWTGRQARLAKALAEQTPTTLGCNIVKCVSPNQAPEDVVARARAWVYLFGRAPLGREVGATDVIDVHGDTNMRVATTGPTPDTVSFTSAPGDTPLQFNHSHLVQHSPAPSSFDARIILKHPGTAITTFRPASDTLNIMWVSQSGELQQTFVSPWWDPASVDALYR